MQSSLLLCSLISFFFNFLLFIFLLNSNNTIFFFCETVPLHFIITIRLALDVIRTTIIIMSMYLKITTCVVNQIFSLGVLTVLHYSIPLWSFILALQNFCGHEKAEMDSFLFLLLCFLVDTCLLCFCMIYYNKLFFS